MKSEEFAAATLIFHFFIYIFHSSSYLSPLEKLGCISEKLKYIWFFVRFALILQRCKNDYGIGTTAR